MATGVADTAEATGSADNVTASVNAELWTTGYTNISELHVTLHFSEPTIGMHWFLIPSGQYRIRPDTPTHAFCIYYPKRVDKETIKCPRDPAGTVYRPGGLGALDEGFVKRISDSFDGYDDPSASIIEGSITLDQSTGQPAAEVEVLVPIRSPVEAKAGSDTYGAMAPIAARNIGDFGSSGQVRPVPREFANAASNKFFAERASGRPLNLLEISSVHVSVNDQPAFETLAFSSPPPTTTDRLAWSSQELRTTGIRYVLHDPLAETSLVRRSFLAGLCASAALAFVFLLIERWFHNESALRDQT